jgi:hypothetical protein
MEALLRNLKVLNPNVSLRRNEDGESSVATPRDASLINKTKTVVIPRPDETAKP